MKGIIVTILICLCSFSCTLSKVSYHDSQKLKILQVDSADIYYVFNTSDKENSIVIAEKEYLKECTLFKKYIIRDSVKQTPFLKEGHRQVFIGANGFEIDDVTIKKPGKLVKYIDNCESFSD